MTTNTANIAEQLKVVTAVKGCIMKNSKTYKSVDFTTNCPKRQAGNPCEYCYVEAKRNMGFNAKKVIDSLKYNSEVLRMTDEEIELLNDLGGIRLFSFGDHMVEQNEDIKAFLIDCRKRGLMVKVITKQTLFLDTFYSEFEDVFSIIHLSVDNIGNGVDHDIAKQYRAMMKKVIIRSVILKHEDIKPMEELSDIMTFNHENIKAKVPNSVNFKLYRKEFAELKLEFAGKMCCQTGSCATCPIKCKATDI